MVGGACVLVWVIYAAVGSFLVKAWWVLWGCDWFVLLWRFCLRKQRLWWCLWTKWIKMRQDGFYTFDVSLLWLLVDSNEIDKLFSYVCNNYVLGMIVFLCRWRIIEDYWWKWWESGELKIKLCCFEVPSWSKYLSTAMIWLIPVWWVGCSI